jgi:hypothetical protein
VSSGFKNISFGKLAHRSLSGSQQTKHHQGRRVQRSWGVQNEIGSKAQPGVQADVFAVPLLRFCSGFNVRQKRGLT